MNLLIKNIQLGTTTTDIEIIDGHFGRIESGIEAKDGVQIIDGANKAILPPFYNAHSHAAMTLLRGYSDDATLHSWLNDYIWPAEAKLTDDDIYAGVRLAILEMIKSGTVFFNDMYWGLDVTMQAVDELGIRADLGLTFIEKGKPLETEEQFRYLDSALRRLPERVSLSVAPHAIYTVSDELYRRCYEYARANGMRLHTHLAETRQEFDDCIAQCGLTPVERLDRIGVLDSDTVAAHVIHVTDRDVEILSERGVIIAHNPCSNMKLSSGSFNLLKLKQAGCRITLGTDGTASNNNLNVIEEMKFAALLSKHTSDPAGITTQYIFDMATCAGASAFGINGGEISTGKVADAILVDLNNERLVPNYNLISNIVYAADSKCVDTVICNGQIVMESGHVKGEEQIIEQAIIAKERLMKAVGR